MNNTLREDLFTAARLTIVVLLVLAGAWWFYSRPKPTPPVTMYIGDPTTACAYPEDTVNIKKLSWQDEQGAQQSWEEFPSLEEAKSAGYRLCR